MFCGEKKKHRTDEGVATKSIPVSGAGYREKEKGVCRISSMLGHIAADERYSLTECPSR